MGVFYDAQVNYAIEWQVIKLKIIMNREYWFHWLMLLINHQVEGVVIPAIAGLVVANIQFQEAKVAFDRMHEMAVIKTEDYLEKERPIHAIDPEWLLQVDWVGFCYPRRSAILKEVSFQLLAGQTTA